MNVAGDSQTLAAAVNHASLNIGNSIGAALGGVVVAAGLGYLAVDLDRPRAVRARRRCSRSRVSASSAATLHRAGGLGLQQDAVLDGALS